MIEELKGQGIDGKVIIMKLGTNLKMSIVVKKLLTSYDILLSCSFFNNTFFRVYKTYTNINNLKIKWPVGLVVRDPDC